MMKKFDFILMKLPKLLMVVHKGGGALGAEAPPPKFYHEEA